MKLPGCSFLRQWPADPACLRHGHYEVNSPYHHIQVKTRANSGSSVLTMHSKTRMSLRDPLQGHYEYTEYFHMACCGHAVDHVCVGLGAAAPNALSTYYPRVRLKPPKSTRSGGGGPHLFQLCRGSGKSAGGGRTHVSAAQHAGLRLIVRNAYRAWPRYGSRPAATSARGVFRQSRAPTSPPNGIVAYNVIGSLTGYRAEIVGRSIEREGRVSAGVSLSGADEPENCLDRGPKRPEGGSCRLAPARCNSPATAR